MAEKATQEVTGVMYVVHLIVYFLLKVSDLTKLSNLQVNLILLCQIDYK